MVEPFHEPDVIAKEDDILLLKRVEPAFLIVRQELSKLRRIQMKDRIDALP